MCLILLYVCVKGTAEKQYSSPTDCSLSYKKSMFLHVCSRAAQP